MIEVEQGRFYVRVLVPRGIRTYPDRAPRGTPHERICGAFVGYRLPGRGPFYVAEFEPDGGLWQMVHERLDAILGLLGQ